MRVYVQGAGNLGRSLGRALRRAGWQVRVRAARGGMARRIEADVVLVALRDPQIRAWAQEVAERGSLAPGAVVLHLAGALGPEELAPLRGLCRGVGRMHPMVAVADGEAGGEWGGSWVHLEGDPAAVRAGRELARSLGMVGWAGRLRDRGLYHAAAGLVAGGAVALMAAALEVLEGAGVRRDRGVKMLAGLLRSAVSNMERLGVPGALTGPVRRGDVERSTGHLRAVARWAPGWAGLVGEVVLAQVGMARELGEATEIEYRQIEHAVRGSKRGIAARRAARPRKKV